MAFARKLGSMSDIWRRPFITAITCVRLSEIANWRVEDDHLRGFHGLVAALVVLASSGCSTTSQTAAEKYIKDSEAQWAESVATNDASVLKRMLADDFLWVFPYGDRLLWSKTEAIADAEEGPGDFLSCHLDEVHVRFFGDTAIAQGSESWVRKGEGNEVVKGRFIWTDVWLRRRGQWQIVQSQDDTIGPAAAPAARH